MRDDQFAADYLEDAADLLEQQGWCTGQYMNGYGQHCSVGALQRVNTKRKNPTGYYGALKWLGKTIGYDERNSSSGRIITWNDATGHTARDVIAAFRKAATAARLAASRSAS